MRLIAALILALAMFSSSSSAETAFDHELQSIDGKPMPLSQWRGKVLLIVNTASFCGYTRQYEGLQALWEKYEKKGLVVVGVPSNDFGGQEPKAESEIAEFCKGAFNVSFPLTAKQFVKGENAHPFYKWARVALRGAEPRWNFHKYLVGRDGRLIAGYPSATEPQSPTLISAVEAALAK